MNMETNPLNSLLSPDYENVTLYREEESKNAINKAIRESNIIFNKIKEAMANNLTRINVDSMSRYDREILEKNGFVVEHCDKRDMGNGVKNHMYYTTNPYYYKITWEKNYLLNKNSKIITNDFPINYDPISIGSGTGCIALGNRSI